jgi:hypothetical protein
MSGEAVLLTTKQKLERARYYARQRSRHERQSILIYESNENPGTYRVAPPPPVVGAGVTWVPMDEWTQVEEVAYERPIHPLQSRPNWFMVRLWQENPTKRRHRKKSSTGRRTCYYDTDPCVYCGKTPNKPSTEHAIPRSQGGPGGWENRVSACYKCNTYRNNWPLLLWLVAIHKHGNPKAAAKALGMEYPDRTVFYRNKLDRDDDEGISLAS